MTPHRNRVIVAFGLAISATALPARAVEPPISAPMAQLPPALAEADFIAFDPKQAELGQLLFYDKILSGNRNISCGTCHHHELGSADGLSLGVGEGGEGLGQGRTTGAATDRIHERVPRNAPALWNLGHKDVIQVFHDGRLARSDAHPSGFQGPAGDEMLHGLNSLLAAQALFPPTSATEMAGQGDENDVAQASAQGAHHVWPILAARVAAIPDYQHRFVAAFDYVDSPEDITFVEIANAIAAFVGTEFRNFDSPFDRFLAGDTDALDGQEKHGMRLFFGEIGCAGCHAGPLLSDQSFHTLGLPHIGPGRTAWFDPMPRDVGRMAITGDLTDAYRFKTPFLRNVALTAPYGHNGAMPTLEDMVRHHVDPVGSLARYRAEMAALRPADWLAERDFPVLRDQTEAARIASALDIALPQPTEAEIAALVAFLHALTGETAQTRPMGVPESVPSGLPLDEIVVNKP